MNKIGKYGFIMAAVLLLTVFATLPVWADVQSGGNRAHGDTKRRWRLGLASHRIASAQNTVGPIAMGLAQAYKITGDVKPLAALQKAGFYSF